MKSKLRNPIPLSDQGRELQRAIQVLGKKKDDAVPIIDLSQGNPAREPVAAAKWEMARILTNAPLSQYASQVIPNVFEITALRYFLKHGVDIDLLVESGIRNGSYTNADKALENLGVVKELIHDPEITGVSLFSPNAKPTVGRLADAIHYLSILGGANNSRDAISTAMRLFDGELVLTARGFYHSFSQLPSMVGKSWELLDTLEERNYKLTAEILAKWCEDNPEKVEKVSSLVLIDPSNPGGAVYSREEKIAIASVCTHYDIPIIEDMIYSGIVLKDGIDTVPMASIAPDNTITFSSVGKSFGCPDLRVGCVIGSPDVIKFFTNYTRTNTGFVSNVMATSAAAVMELTPDSYFSDNNRDYNERIGLVKERIERINKSFPSISEDGPPFITTNDPDGGFFILARFPGLKGKYYDYENCTGRKIGIINDSVNVAEFFLDSKQGGVCMPPTISSGIPGEALEVRISVGDNPPAKLNKAFDRMEAALCNLMEKQETYKSKYEQQQRATPMNR